MKNIIETMDDFQLFAPHFQPSESWTAWRVFLKALFALPMTEDDIILYRQCTGRTNPPTVPFTEAWLPTGRRGGKSRILALVAVYLGVFKDYSQYLAAGERATIQVLAADRKQARSIFRYAKALIAETPLLAPLIEDESQETLDLHNRVSLENTTSSFRTTRGYTCAAALADEIAFWRTEDDSANQDTDVINAVRHAMSTIPGALLLAASSPYARRGELWKNFHEHHGKDDSPILVWKAPTSIMNPSIPKHVIAAAYARDPIAARAEYGAEFRSDIEAFLSREVIQAVTVPGRFELPYRSGISYQAFCDPSGGVKDAYTLAIAHAEDNKAVLDMVREVRPPFSPESVTSGFADALKAYGLKNVCGDKYGSEWIVERFAEHGITYQHSEKTRSDLYLELLPAVNSGLVELLDIPRMREQFVGLERRAGRLKDVVDHAPSGSDDVCNSAAGALYLAASSQRKKVMLVGPGGDTQISPHNVAGYSDY